MEIITSIVSLLSGLAIFLVGIHQMSAGLENISSQRMQKGLSKVSNNRFLSFGFGAFITAVMQSSTLVTVMTISFLNANLLSLAQGIAIVLGANIGTTLTALISSFATVEYAIYLSLFTLVGVLMEMFAKKTKTKKFAQIFVGFGLIFIGLNFASSSFQTPEMKDFISSAFQAVNFPVLLIIISILFTILVNSSTLVVGLAIILVSSQTIPLEYALYIVLGAEVGTTSTGIIASLSGNANAKRLAFIQLIFNLLGTIVFTAILWIFTDEIVGLLNNVNPNFQVALFQIFFNVSTAFIAILFVNQLEKFSKKIIKDDTTSLASMNLQFIDEKLLVTPSFALTALHKEVKRMFDLTKENLILSFQSIKSQTPINPDIVKKNEETIDFLNGAISLYLVKLSGEHLSYKDELEIGKLYHLINDLERIADHAHNFILIVEEMVEVGSKFSGAAESELNQMTDQVLLMYDLAEDIYQNDAVEKLNELSVLEYVIDKSKSDFENNHVIRLRTGECSLEHSKFFYDFTSQLERIGDHLINIGYTTINVVGDEKENEKKFVSK
ncbi:Na/Pi cotransporter family protein [Acholeplasma hippikon]|uniref:Na/Pi-cotransporter II-related protein n=1 Tax=Acholeplasma hippikon TaxID=264636 RepID=A0A449BKX7_9MOLU|nr:Na/Pi cotransporter family protein [Acholeplasma hippikon]VEU83125.1 Na/Pi-cotransporter II-related protein [Acholeplasma hippikon]